MEFLFGELQKVIGTTVDSTTAGATSASLALSLGGCHKTIDMMMVVRTTGSTIVVFVKGRGM